MFFEAYRLQWIQKGGDAGFGALMARWPSILVLPAQAARGALIYKPKMAVTHIC